MRKLFLSICLMAFACGSYATSADPSWITMTQPDGTTIELRLMGDEFYHYWVNQDGLEVQKNDAGYWVVATTQLSPRQRQARRAASPMYESAAVRKASASRPSNVLVILMNFSDVQLQSKHNYKYYDALLNQLDSASVRQYFKESSDGNYIPHFDVWGPYTADSAMAYYGGDDANGNDMRVGCLIHEACEKAHADGCNFANYDEDGDGVVDNINVIFAGYAESSGGGADCIWPNKWNMRDCRNCGGNYYYDGKRLYSYSCSAELRGGSGTNSASIGTFCHEFSHILGMPDYYDTKYGSNYSNAMTPGRWSLMDQGNYNNNSQSPPLYSVFDKCYMGWAETPALLAKDAVQNVTMPYGTEYCKTITGGTVALPYNSVGDTIYYLENRPQTGYFDIGLPYGGMLIWRVIYKDGWGAVNNITGLIHYTVLSAYGYETDLGWGRDCYPGPSKVKNKTVKPGCELTNIALTDNVITFKYNGGEETKMHHTWMANGDVFAQTQNYIQVNLPTPNPAACSADTTFFGWTLQTVMQKDGSDFVKFNNLDEAPQDTTFYAVYRTITQPYRYSYFCGDAPKDTTHIYVNIPPGQTYTWRGRVLEVGEYFDTIKTVNKDSILMLHLAEIAPEKLVKIYFYNTPDWKNVTYHVWGGTGIATSAPYPTANKESFTHDGHTVWSFSFEEGQYNNILFLSKENKTYRTTALTDLSANRGKCLNTDKDNLSDPAWWTPVPTQNWKVTYGMGTGGATVAATANDAAVTSNSYVDDGTMVTFTQTAAAGYQFKEWNTKQDGSGDALSTDATYTTQLMSDIKVYAIFETQTYTITYMDKDSAAFSGVHGDEYPTTHTYNTATTLKTATKKAYVFEGWYTSKDCSTGLVTSLGKTAFTSNIILYAKWREAAIVSVYFYNQLDWDGVRFHAWGGTLPSTEWPGLDAVRTDTARNGHYVYRVSFYEGEYDRIKFNDKQNAGNQTGTLYDMSLSLGKCAFYDKSADPTTWWADMPVRNYVVTFKANGHGIAPAAVWADHNSKIAEPTTMTTGGYIFENWCKDSLCTNDWDFASDVVTSTTTLYAKWREANTIKVYYYNYYDWDSVRCYGYGGSLGAVPAWPGFNATLEPITHDGHTIWSASFLEGEYANVQFNDRYNDKHQTARMPDVVTHNGKCVYFDKTVQPNSCWWDTVPPQNYKVHFGHDGHAASVTAMVNNTTPINSGAYVNASASVTFSATAQAGYAIKEWKTSLDSAGTTLVTAHTYTTTISDSTKAYAVFEQQYAPTGAIIGTMNGWDHNIHPLTNGVVTIHLAEATTYQFKVLMGSTCYSNNSTLTRESCTNKLMESNVVANCQITSVKEGDYIFVYNNSLLTVYYPYYIESGLGGLGWTPDTNPFTTINSGIYSRTFNSQNSATYEYRITRGSGYEGAPGWEKNQVIDNANSNITISLNNNNKTFTTAKKSNVTVYFEKSSLKTWVIAEPTYKIIYDANGATSGTAPVDTSRCDVAYNTVRDTVGNGPLMKTGMLFRGWNTKADGTGTRVAVGTQITLTKDTTLYAEWSAPADVKIYFFNLYDWKGVRYHAWGGSLPSTKWPGLDATLEPLTRDGHTVYSISFSEGEYRNLKFNDKQNDKNQSGGFYDALTYNGKCAYYDSTKLTKNWWDTKPVQNYKVTFGYGEHGASISAKKGGTEAISSGNYVDVNGSVTFTATGAANYALKEWNTKADGTGTTLSTDASYVVTITQDTAIYAIFESNLRVVYLDLSSFTSWEAGNTYGPANFRVNDGTSNVLMTKVNDCTNSHLYTAEVNKTSTYKFYRMNPDPSWSHVRWDSASVALANPNNACKVTTWHTGSATAVTCHYGVTFNNNGHGASVNDTCVVDGQCAKDTTLTADGFIFNGWYTDAELTNKFNFTTPIKSATTLYAKWGEIMNNVIVVSNDAAIMGTVSPANASAGISTTATITATGKTGYYLQNWTKPANVTIAEGTTTSATIMVNATANDDTLKANFAGRYVFRGTLLDGTSAGMPGWGNNTPIAFNDVWADQGHVTYTLEANKTYKFQVRDVMQNVYIGVPEKGTKLPVDTASYMYLNGTQDVHFITRGAGDYEFLFEFDDNAYTPTAACTPKIKCNMKFKSYQIAFGVNSNTMGAVIATSNDSSFTNNQWVAQGDSVVFTATPNTGYVVEGWYTNAECTEGKHDEGALTYTVNDMDSATASKPIYMKFQEVTHTVAVVVNYTNMGQVSVASVSGVGVATKSAAITATPKAGCYFTGWTIPDGVTLAEGTTSSTTIKIYATADNDTIKANFAGRYAFRGSHLSDGNKGMPGWGNNTPVAFNDVHDGQGHVTYTLEANKTYKFKLYDKTQTSYAGCQTKGTKLTINGTYFTQMNGTEDFHFDTQGAGEYEFLFGFDNGTYTPTAYCTPKVKSHVAFTSYQIPFGANNGSVGTVTATAQGVAFTNNQYVAQGDNVVFTAAPNANYEVEGWYNNAECAGTPVAGGQTTYTISNIAAAQTVYVKFRAVDDSKPGITHSGSATYQLGTAAIKLNAQYSNVTDAATYAWTGAGVTFSSATEANPNVSAAATGTYVICVTVTDGGKTNNMYITLTVTGSEAQCAGCFPQTGSTH